jgi:hypothetical protein
VWLCAYHGYVYAFELHSKKHSSERSAEPKPHINESQWLEAFQASNRDGRAPPKTPPGGHRLAETQALVYRFAQGLPQGYSWLLLLDNLFVNQPLLALLRKDLGIGAMGTTRKNARGIPWQLLEKRDTVKHTWGSTTPMIVGEVLMALWQDNAPLVFMTTARSLENGDDLVAVDRRRPAITTANRSIIEPVFGSLPRKQLPIPRAINDYNHGMNGGDVANQLRVTYDPQRREQRTWRALFQFFFKTSLVNAYLLHHWQKFGPPNDESEEAAEARDHQPRHRMFREALIEACWSYTGLVGPTAPSAINHDWQKLDTRSRSCILCRSRGGTNTLKMKAKKRNVLGQVSENIIGRPSRTSWGCKQCQVALCKEGDCWGAYHNKQ